MAKPDFKPPLPSDSQSSGRMPVTKASPQTGEARAVSQQGNQPPHPASSQSLPAQNAVKDASSQNIPVQSSSSQNIPVQKVQSAAQPNMQANPKVSAYSSTQSTTQSTVNTTNTTNTTKGAATMSHPSSLSNLPKTQATSSQGSSAPAAPQPPSSGGFSAPPEPSNPLKTNKSGSSRGKVIGISIAAVVVVAAIIVGFIFYWFYNARSISLEVDGAQYQVQAGTTMQNFLEKHNYFGKTRGAMLSVKGKVLRPDGGQSPWVTFNSENIPQQQNASYKIEQGGVLIVHKGADEMEPHEVKKITITPDVTLHVNGAIGYIKEPGIPGLEEQLIGSISGEKVTKVIRKATNTIVDYINPQPKGPGKYVALTFDDGPSKYTPQFLDILKKYDAKATFFSVGTEVTRYPQYERMILEAGNEIGNHTWNHPQLPLLSGDAARAEVVKTSDAIMKATGRKEAVAMVRPPYGAVDQHVWKELQYVMSSAILWTADTRDWAKPGSNAIYKNAIAGVHNGSIILMHSGGGNREETLKALPQILQELTLQGYKFVTISELERLDGRFPKAVMEGVPIPAPNSEQIAQREAAAKK